MPDSNMNKPQNNKIRTVSLVSPETLHPKLNSGEIHTWLIDASCTVNLTEFRSVLTSVESEKACYLKTEEAQNSYISSQGSLRFLLSKYLNIPPETIRLGRHAKGKPFSEDQPNLRFNLSNSANLVAIAFTYDSEIGIDIEQIRPLPDLEEMIQSNFSTNEIKIIQSKPEETLKRFFRFWTLKESYLKAIGEGMRIEPQNIEFTLNKYVATLLSVRGLPEQEDWNFKNLTFSTDYAATLCHQNTNPTLTYFQLKLI